MLTSVMPELPRLPFILVNIHTTNSMAEKNFSTIKFNVLILS